MATEDTHTVYTVYSTAYANNNFTRFSKKQEKTNIIEWNIILIFMQNTDKY